MSRIIFDTRNERYEILGRERAHGVLLFPPIANAMIGTAGIISMPTDPQPFTPGMSDDRLAEMANLIVKLQSDALTVFLRISTQCEIHGWVDGCDLPWFCDMLQKGVDAGILREGMGWERLISDFRSIEPEPVIMSFSGSDTFPYSGVIRPEGMDWSDWDKFDTEQQWRIAMDLLREETSREERGILKGGDSRQIRPQNWHTYKFIS
jgi:hypothetical protein